MKEKLFHPKLQLLVRIVLGGILVYASWHKIADPPDFAKIIYNYRLFPPASIHMLAVFVPWIELVAGLALISGIGLRGGALMAAIFFSFAAATLPEKRDEMAALARDRWAAYEDCAGAGFDAAVRNLVNT